MDVTEAIFCMSHRLAAAPVLLLTCKKSGRSNITEEREGVWEGEPGAGGRATK